MAITRVWIEEGCISCNLCMDLCPDVFEVVDGDVCRIKPAALDHFVSQQADIRLAADDCPVEVIRLETGAPVAGEGAGT
jgi:ferredoxin